MIRAASFFAGVGGIDLGFEMAGIKTVYANEIDPYAAKTYALNFPSVDLDQRDIRVILPEEIPPFDILLAGFPCQAFSIAGHRQGFLDEKGRGNLFFELVRIMKVKKPRVAFFENVKNLVHHDHGNTFKVICSELEKLGYLISCKVMNAKEYGNIPQNRERIYIVAFRDLVDYFYFSMPSPTPRTKTVRDIIDFSTPQDLCFYYTPVNCSFYSALEKDIKRHDTVYQWRRSYVRENKSNVVPTLTAIMGSGGHNIPLIFTDDGRVRKLTPRECFNAQGFPETFLLPPQTCCHLYKQAGNSVVVPVVARIAKNIANAINLNC